MLLASLGKGGALAAAVALPMQSLASIGTLAVTANGKRCTISGTMSNIHSRETVTATCSGWSPAYYLDITKWPSYHVTSNPNAQNSVNGGLGTFNKNTLFSGLFGGGSSNSLMTVLNSGGNDERTWVAAVLNGTAGSRGVAANFPYTAAQVIGFYTAGGVTRSNALTFFQNFMQTNQS